MVSIYMRSIRSQARLAWFASPGTAYLLNVGDCRIYQLQPRKPGHVIRQLTVDQTYASLAQQPPPNGRPEDPARMVGAGAVGVPISYESSAPEILYRLTGHPEFGDAASRWRSYDTGLNCARAIAQKSLFVSTGYA